MKIAREDVLRVAELAHLELSEAEIEMFSRQLDSILTYVDKLNKLDTSNVEPMAQVAPPTASGQGTAGRDDVFGGIAGDRAGYAPSPRRAPAVRRCQRRPRRRARRQPSVFPRSSHHRTVAFYGNLQGPARFIARRAA